MSLTSTEAIRLIRDGDKGGEGGEREVIYLLLHCHHQNDFWAVMRAILMFQ